MIKSARLTNIQINAVVKLSHLVFTLHLRFVVICFPISSKMNAGIQGGLSKLKKKHFRVKHQKVKLFRANEPLLSVFMWGVNHTVSSVS